IYCIILTMLKKNEILKIINSAAAQLSSAQLSSAQLSSAQLSSSITLNFLKFYVYLLIIKTIIFILNSYLIKSFIQSNYYITKITALMGFYLKIY
ncbi:hypothetical protein, partial [Brachyspira aalborgi]|uniref:hypothetical protein n=1 Tax=Brachyspira aalborgi TaxID=29522 RepID=UPI001A7E5DA6